MRAVRFHEYGPPEVLQIDDVADPEPGTDEVLVQVSAAGIGFADVQIRAGLMRPLLDPPLPYHPGFEVVGTVVAAGADVDAAVIGSQVVGSTAGGGYAELAVLPAATARPVPKALDVHTALALVGQGTAAVGVARAAAMTAGDTVLVQSAAGGVGGLLVQLAKRAGTTVIATAGGERKLAAAARHGADVVVDHRQPDWPDRVRTAAGGTVSVVLESTGGAASQTAFDLLTPGTGRMVVYGTTSGEPPRFEPVQVYHRGVSVAGFASVALPPAGLAALVDEAFALGVSGDLRPVAGAVWPLEQAADAHRAFEERTVVGKATLTP